MTVLSPPPSALRHIRFSPLGRHTAYMFAGYLRHVFIVVSILMAIGLTIDLWPQVQMVAGRGEGTLGAVWSVVRFAMLRTPGVIAPLIPFATYLGVVWTEVAHTQSGERMLVWNSGRSPEQCLAPVALLAVLLGTAVFVMDGYLGPASMAVQMHERLGRDGERLDRARFSKPSWIALPQGLLRTQIAYGPPPLLHNPMLFQRDRVGQLVEVDMATVARRDPDTGKWVMHDGRSWVAADRKAADVSASEVMVPFAERAIPIDIDPVWLANFDLQPQYLSLGVLHKLAATANIPGGVDAYKTRLNTILGETLLPGAMAALAATLSMLLLAYGTPIPGLIVIVFAGYIAHFGTKACLLLGQNGYMAPVLAGWLVPISLIAATLAVLAVIELRRRSSA